MALRSKHKVDAAFSMSSMTDVIFLLLIFFMLTSSFITPSGLPVNLPTSANSNIVMPKITVTVTENLDYLVNDKPVPFSRLESVLKQELNGQEGVVVLHVDKSVPTENLVNVASIAAGLKAKVSLATKPN